ncbi:hypothetical protein IBX73_10460 [candidate division WOR-3 bacterium]|nr:hypothetical protein [candidate division WOR-3 bacterium]
MKKKRVNTDHPEGNIDEIRKRIFAGKARFHSCQASLPFPEKIRILVKLQRAVQRVRKSGGFVWDI